jgi:hypothetical protein
MLQIKVFYLILNADKTVKGTEVSKLQFMCRIKAVELKYQSRGNRLGNFESLFV